MARLVMMVRGALVGTILLALAAGNARADAGQAPSPADVEAKIYQRVGSSPYLRDIPYEVKVDRNGVATITGLVDTQAEMDLIGQLAEVKGVSRVFNEVSVLPNRGARNQTRALGAGQWGAGGGTPARAGSMSQPATGPAAAGPSPWSVVRGAPSPAR